MIKLRLEYLLVSYFMIVLSFVESHSSEYQIAIDNNRQVDLYFDEIYEASEIWRVESLISKYKNLKGKDKANVLAELTRMVQKFSGSFTEIVILSAFSNLGELSAAQEFGYDNSNQLFVFLNQIEKQKATLFINKVNNPGFKQFLKSWHAFLGYTEARDQEFDPSIGQVAIKKEYLRISKQLDKVSDDEKSTVLFKYVENWETSVQYEAAMQLIADEYLSSPDVIMNKIIVLLKKYESLTVPPPFSRQHTIFYIAGILIKTVGGDVFKKELNELSSSENSYISKISKEVLSWIKKDVKYPLKYRELRRSYYSQS